MAPAAGLMLLLVGTGASAWASADDTDKLTARAVYPPAHHTGMKSFSVWIEFSARVPKRTRRTLRDAALRVDGGMIRWVRYRGRYRGPDDPRRRMFEVRIRPDSNGPVTISLAPPKDCAEAGAVCTKGGRPLSQALKVEIPGPPPPSCFPTQGYGCLAPDAYHELEDKLAPVHRSHFSFANQWGLGKIGADRAWARIELAHGKGTEPGSGQTVGVVDSGIDKDHPSFAGKAITEEFLGGAKDEDGRVISHGTAVAGVIAGRPGADDTNAARGVAWGADIAMFAVPTGRPRWMYHPTTLATLSDYDSKWKGRIDKLLNWRGEAGRRIDFVNVSLGLPGIIEQYSEVDLRASFGKTIAALARAGAGRRQMIFVWSAGNAHGRGCNAADFPAGSGLCVNGKVVARSVQVYPGLPARFPGLRGRIIAVVAIGRNGAIAPFSNRCGIAADWCLAAPGTNMRTAYFGPSGRSVMNRGGTSYAAPMVTGALTVMKHYFRGQLANDALVSRLLATADKEGIYADRAVYGQGLLDLDTATEPVGVAGVTFGGRVGQSPRVSLASTSLALGGAFGTGPGLALTEQEVVAFDDLGAPFWYSLGGFVQSAPDFSVAARLDAFMAPSEDGPGTEGGRRSLLGGFAPGEGSAAPGWPRLGLVEAPDAGLAGGHLSLAGGALSLGSQSPDGLGFAAFSTEGLDGRAPVSGALLSWRPPDAPVGLRGGWLGERETLLGSRAEGAFGQLSADSVFVGLDGGARAGAWRLDASAEIGAVHVPTTGGMLTDLSSVISSAFALRAERPLGGAGSLRLQVSQPLRVESGRARLSVPIGRTPDGEVLRRSLAIDLTPAGRQIDFSAHWRRKLAVGELRLGAAWTLHPGHDDEAPPDFTLLAGWRHSF